MDAQSLPTDIDARRVVLFKVPEFRRAYWDGERAWNDGLGAPNPYFPSDPRRVAWHDGYRNAQLIEDRLDERMADLRG